MPKEPKKTDVDALDTEASVETAAERAIEEAVPPELQQPARSGLQAILRETRERPVSALLVAAAVGYAFAALTGR